MAGSVARKAVTIVNIQPEHFAALELLQRICYPTLGVQELMLVEHYAAQYKLFAEGQFVALEGDGSSGQVVGQGSGFLTDFDFDHPGHTFREICDGFYFTRHDPEGAYYYGADISVHPDWRGQGIGKLIYAARKALVQRTNRRGIIAGGMIPDYARFHGVLTPHEYVAKVVAGELTDATLSFQLRQGFRVRGLLENYLEDASSLNWATLIVWENPDYLPTSA